MEVHEEGVVLAWQSRIIDAHICISVAGTKAFYGAEQPKLNEPFAETKNVLQLNIINRVFPKIIQAAFTLCSQKDGGNYPQQQLENSTLTLNDLNRLVNADIARRWVGNRSVAFDNLPTIGSFFMMQNGVPFEVQNGFISTHWGSGGNSAGAIAAELMVYKMFPEFRRDTNAYYDMLLQKINPSRHAETLASRISGHPNTTFSKEVFRGQEEKILQQVNNSHAY